MHVLALRSSVFFSLPSFQFSVIAATNYTTRCPTCTALNDAWRMNKYLKCKQFAPAHGCAGSPKIVAALASVARSLFLSWGGIIKRSWIFPIVFHWQQHLSHLAEQFSTSLVFLLCPVSGLLFTALSRKPVRPHPGQRERKPNNFGSFRTNLTLHFTIPSTPSFLEDVENWTCQRYGRRKHSKTLSYLSQRSAPPTSASSVYKSYRLSSSSTEWWKLQPE